MRGSERRRGKAGDARAARWVLVESAEWCGWVDKPFSGSERL